MPRKMSTKQAIPPARGKPGDVLPVRIVVDPTEETPVYYANHAEVSLSPHEISVSFVRVPSKLSSSRTKDAQVSGSLTFEPTVQVVIPPTLLPGLIKAMTITKDQYEEKCANTADVVKVQTTQSPHLVPAKEILSAVYAQIQAMRALGKTQVGTAEIARALGIHVAEVERTVAALRTKGVRRR